MYETIKGKLIDKSPTKAIVETFGVGYRIHIPLSTYQDLPSQESEVLLFLSHVVREDSSTLYGFIHKNQRDFFEVLITISGIGPKTAIGILGHIELETFQRAIESSDIKLLSKLPGIGKKTAERLIIEMRDKLKVEKFPSTILAPKEGGVFNDAYSALVNLGYHPIEAQKAVKKAMEEEMDDLGKILTKALQKN